MVFFWCVGPRVLDGFGIGLQVTVAVIRRSGVSTPFGARVFSNAGAPIAAPASLSGKVADNTGARVRIARWLKAEPWPAWLGGAPRR